jgi:hypothetical protein
VILLLLLLLLPRFLKFYNNNFRIVNQTSTEASLAVPGIVQLYSTNRWPDALQVYRGWNKQPFNCSKQSVCSVLGKANRTSAEARICRTGPSEVRELPSGVAGRTYWPKLMENFKQIVFFKFNCWSERSACAALRRCRQTVLATINGDL